MRRDFDATLPPTTPGCPGGSHTRRRHANAPAQPHIGEQSGECEGHATSQPDTRKTRLVLDPAIARSAARCCACHTKVNMRCKVSPGKCAVHLEKHPPVVARFKVPDRLSKKITLVALADAPVDPETPASPACRSFPSDLPELALDAFQKIMDPKCGGVGVVRAPSSCVCASTHAAIMGSSPKSFPKASDLSHH